MSGPTVKTKFADLPADASQRREALLDHFGQHLFSLRNELRDRVRFHIESEEARRKMGAIPARPYAAVAALDASAREAALNLADEVIDRYIQRILMLFQSTGNAWRLGDDHAIRYRLYAEIIGITDEDETVLAEALINRDTELAMGSYFGGWLNRHGNHR